MNSMTEWMLTFLLPQQNSGWFVWRILFLSSYENSGWHNDRLAMTGLCFFKDFCHFYLVHRGNDECNLTHFFQRDGEQPPTSNDIIELSFSQRS